MISIAMGSGYLHARFSALITVYFLLARVLGVRNFDTAQFYGDGEGEMQVGRNLAPDSGWVVTKVGLAKGLGNDFESADRWYKFFRPEKLEFFCTQSLERLRRKKIDVLLLHCPNQEVDFSQHVLALRSLQTAGMIGEFGFSADTAAQVPQETSWASVVEVNVGLLEKIKLEECHTILVNGVFRLEGGLRLLLKELEKGLNVNYVILMGSTKPWRIFSSWLVIRKLQRFHNQKVTSSLREIDGKH